MLPTFAHPSGLLTFGPTSRSKCDNGQKVVQGGEPVTGRVMSGTLLLLLLLVTDHPLLQLHGVAKVFKAAQPLRRGGGDGICKG